MSHLRWKSVARYVAIVLISAAVAVVMAEIYLSSRATSPLTLPFYNELYPYVMFRPHKSATYISAEPFAMSHFTKQVFHYTNEDGFRVRAADYQIPKTKPAGQLRIAVLGGSAVQLGSTFEDTLPGALERFLEEKYPDRDIEVINAGIQSCVSRQSIAHLVFTVLGYQPDIVILYDGVNDLGLPLTYESRANIPYNFHVMEEAWELYRGERRSSWPRLILDRSHLYAALGGRVSQHAGPTAIPASQVISDEAYRRSHIAGYLSNWRKLVELSAAYNYKAMGVLQPTGGLDSDYALKLTMTEFNLSEQTAREWMEAFTLLYAEADSQIEQLRAEYPEATFLNLTGYLQPPEECYWDLVHVYDEKNPVLAARLHTEIEAWLVA
ncbi:MAG: hypothetical protein GY953_10680, partial [bacterium]|nr:hypothetical protein [bacterium]